MGISAKLSSGSDIKTLCGGSLGEKEKTRLLHTTLLLSSLTTLAGCPGSGDRLQPDEEARVSMMSNRICFEIGDADNYQLSAIAISPRGTPFNQQKFMFGSYLKIADGKLCIPPSFWPLPDKGQFIVRYILTSVTQSSRPRKIVTGVEVSSGQVFGISLTDQEALR